MDEKISKATSSKESGADDARRKLLLAGTVHWWHWLVLTLSIGLTLFAWRYADSQRLGRVNVKFDREAEQIETMIRERMRKYEDALWSAVAMIQVAGGDVDVNQWEEYSSQIQISQKYPGINGIGLVHALDSSSVDEYMSKQRKLRPTYKIHPAHPGNIFYPISFIFPTKPNEAAVGLDMAYEENRFTAARKACESGLPQVTGPIVLVQDSNHNPGFLLFVPFYRNQLSQTQEEREANFAGLIYAPFVFNNLVRGALEKERRHVGIQLSDQGQIIYDEHVNSESDFDTDPLFQRSRTLEIYGRQWKLDLGSALSFRTVAADHQPLTILMGGILLDSLLLLLFLSISRASKQALGYADSMTEQLAINNDDLQQEVTERRRAENELKSSVQSLHESETKLRGLFDQGFSYVGLLTIDGELIGINRTALTEGRVAESDVLGCRYWETVWFNHSRVAQDRLKLAVAMAAEGQTDCFESTHTNLDGLTRHTYYSLKPIRDHQGRILFLVSEGRDISDQKRDEAKLSALLEELAESNRELEQFAYIASHDLQEPLRKITSYGELLREECGDQINQDGHEYVDIIVNAGNRLRILVRDLLAFSQITTEGKTIGPIETTACLITAIENLEVVISECQATITYDPLPSTIADEGLITTLFQNLLSNAIKYRGDEPPLIHIGYSDSGDQLEFLVRDNGIGIESKYFDRIFEIFKRLHNRRTYSGTGIGLALCKRIVDRLNGKMRVESTLGEGSTFYFTLQKSDMVKPINLIRRPTSRQQSNSTRAF